MRNWSLLENSLHGVFDSLSAINLYKTDCNDKISDEIPYIIGHLEECARRLVVQICEDIRNGGNQE